MRKAGGARAKRHPGIRLALLAVGALAIAAAAGPAAASAGWMSPVGISAPGKSSRDPRVAVDDHGRAVLTWASSNGRHYLSAARRMSAAGALGAIHTLSTAGVDATDQDVAVDPQGQAVLSWRWSRRGGPQVQARTVSAAGALGPVTGVSLPGWGVVRDTGPRAAIDDGGTAVLVWDQGDVNARLDSYVVARTLSASGALGPSMVLRDTRFNCSSLSCAAPKVALTPLGQAVFTWLNPFNGRIEARTMSPSGTLDPPITVSRFGDETDEPQVAIDDAGNAVFVWEDRTTGEIQTRSLSTAGALGALKVVAPITSLSRRPQVAVTGDGRGTLVWLGDDGTDTRILARRLTTSGYLGAVKTVSAQSPSAHGAHLAVDDGGNATIVWADSNGVQVRKLFAAGTLGPVKTFAATGVAAAPQVAVASGGEAVVTWDTNDRIRATIRR